MEMPDSLKSTYVYDDTTVRVEDDKKLVVILDEENSSSTIDATNLDSAQQIIGRNSQIAPKNVMTTDSGDSYYAIATINIPKLNWDKTYPILDHWSDELLKISPCKFHGANPNEVGNFCIVGHNYRNSLFFSKIPSMVENGDVIEIEDNYGRKVNYIVYDKHVVNENDTRDTSQITHGKREITVITCTNDSKNRVILRAKEEGK